MGLCCHVTLLSSGVCLSLCLSVTLVYCIQTAEDIVKRLSRPVARHSSFLNHSAGTQFLGNPFNGASKYTGVRKCCDLRLKSPFISETVADRPMVTMER